MLPDPPEPILGIPVIGLAAVHDGVPVAPLKSVDILADAVRLVEKVLPQPECRDAALGEVVVDPFVAGKERFLGERLQGSSNREIRLARSQLGQAIGAHKLSDEWAEA